MKSITVNEAGAISVMGYSGEIKIRTFFGNLERNPDEPQAFLLEYPTPNARIQPHFHDIDQFQVVVKGNELLSNLVYDHQAAFLSD